MMLRRSRLASCRAVFGNLRHRSSVALAEAVDHSTPDNEDGYGLDYGAGPSRIPYTSPTQISSDSDPQLGRYAGAADHHRFYAPGSSLFSARQLRRNLAALQHGDYTSLDIVARKISRETSDGSETSTKTRKRTRSGHSTRPLSVLSRLELHIVLHHLLRVHQPMLAAAVMSETAKAGASTKPKRRRVFASQTVETLFHEIKGHLPSRQNVKSKWTRRLSDITLSPFTSNQQSIVPSASVLSNETKVLVDLLDSLQEIRHRRPNVMYEILIRQCVNEGRPDIAAKVYVGLVEEWVTEGRVAEGADIDDFCEGGGPNEKLEIQLVSDQMATWWQGVRTWRLPGEVLSPHGRLDLWHPKNLSLGEKMKGFPMPVPTSPPTIVPAPETGLLLAIINSLRLDPTKSSPEEHAASMRALAYLANTVLSRTLPVSSLRGLFQAMSATVHRPAVYPESIDPEQIPQSDRWAYESFTQIHLALQSLLSAPPMSTSSIRYAESVESAREKNPGAPPHPPPAPSGYMLPPLTWTSCLVLLRYGMSRLMMPTIVGRLVVYMKSVFGAGHTNPKAHNIMLEAATKMRDNEMAQMVSRPLFGDLIAQKAPRKDTTSDDEAVITGDMVAIGEALELDHPEAKLQPIADERSLTALVTHLTATSRLQELEKLVYTLVPFLSSKSPSIYSDSPEGPRPAADHLPLALYPVILSGLRKAGKTGLAQRMYKLAVRAESDLLAQQSERTTRHKQTHTGPARLHIDTFTNMIEVYANEVRHTVPGREYVKGWSVDTAQAAARRDNSAAAMAWRTYSFASARWRNASTPSDLARCAPDVAFFVAITRACSQRWDLNGSEPLEPRLQGELRTVYKDMVDFGIPVFERFEKIANKLGMEVEAPNEGKINIRPGRDPAKALADMWLGHEEAQQTKNREISL